MVEKVTIFLTRRGPQGPELLLFEHSNASIQIPAGTVEPGEQPEAAALREGREETGLAGIGPLRPLGAIDTELPPDRRIVASPTAVYARPRLDSINCAQFSRGITLRVERAAPGFTHVTYREMDRQADPQYISYCITGWVPDEALSASVRRYFFLSDYSGPIADRWPVYDPPHRWVLFWAPLAALPRIHKPQDEWLRMLPDDLVV